MAVNSNPADTVTRYLGMDSNISVAQLGNISAVEAIAGEISDVTSGLTQLGNSMAQLQKMEQAAVTEEQNRQATVDALSAQVAQAQSKVAGDSSGSTNSKSTHSQLTADQSTLASLQKQLGSATFQLTAQEGYVASLQQQMNQLQQQINAAQTQLNNLRTQAMPAAQEVDDENRQQQQSTHTAPQSNQQTNASPAQMTLAARLRAQLTPGNNAASILDGLPYDQEKQQQTGGGDDGGGGAASGAGGGDAGGGSGAGSATGGTGGATG